MKRTVGKPIRVLLVSPAPPPLHGASFAAQQLLRAAPVWGGNIEIFHIDARFADSVADLERVRFKKIARLIRYAGKMIRELCLGRVEVVILTPTFLAKPFLKDALFIWLCRLGRVRWTVAWFHMSFGVMKYEERSPFYRWFVRTTLRRCDRYVCVADGLRSKLPDFLPGERIQAVTNGVPDLAGGIPPARSKDKQVTVLYLSNMSEAKGWRLLLEQAEKLGAVHPEVRFEFFGAPTRDNAESAIRDRFGRSSLGERVRYGGMVEGDEKREALSRASIFCLPSYHEAFPLAILEAMSFGLPVLTTDVGAIRDAVHEGSGGFVIEAGNGEALSEGLQSLITDSELRKRMGHYNRQLYEDCFTEERYAERWRSFLYTLR